MPCLRDPLCDCLFDRCADCPHPPARPVRKDRAVAAQRFRIGDIVLLHGHQNSVSGVVQITGIPPEPSDETKKYLGVVALSPIAHCDDHGQYEVSRHHGATFNAHYSELGLIVGHSRGLQ